MGVVVPQRSRGERFRAGRRRRRCLRHGRRLSVVAACLAIWDWFVRDHDLWNRSRLVVLCGAIHPAKCQPDVQECGFEISDLHRQRRPVRAIARYWRRHACCRLLLLLLVKKRSFRSCATRKDVGQSSECKFLCTYAKSTKYDSEQGCFLLLSREGVRREKERWRRRRRK